MKKKENYRSKYLLLFGVYSGALFAMQSNNNDLPQLYCKEEFNLEIDNKTTRELVTQAYFRGDFHYEAALDFQFLNSMKELMGDPKKTAWVKSIISQLSDVNQKHQQYKSELLWHICASKDISHRLEDFEITNIKTLLQNNASCTVPFYYDYYFKKSCFQEDINCHSIVGLSNSLSIASQDPRLLRTFLKNGVSPLEHTRVRRNDYIVRNSQFNHTSQDIIIDPQNKSAQLRLNLLLYFGANPYTKFAHLLPLMLPPSTTLNHTAFEFINLHKRITTQRATDLTTFIEKMYKERLVQVISQHANNYIFKKAMHLPKELAIMIADFAIEEFKRLDWEKKALALKFEPICWKECEK